MKTDRTKTSLEQIQQARQDLLGRVVEFFSKQPGVVGLLLAGSIPSGSADAYSDIDLRVFTTPETHADFVQERLEIPRQWGELLFNEWSDGSEVCVSHFQPFLKIDVFYWNIEKVKPSAWFNLPSKILLDRGEALHNFLTRCADIEFEKPSNQKVSHTVSKALACAHESLRRSRRGELFYAQSLLERVRSYAVLIEDWVNRFEPEIATDLKLEKRISSRLQNVLKQAYPPLNARKIEESLIVICELLADQINDLHRSFTLDRALEKDLAAIELITDKQIIEPS